MRAGSDRESSDEDEDKEEQAAPHIDEYVILPLDIYFLLLLFKTTRFHPET